MKQLIVFIAIVLSTPFSVNAQKSTNDSIPLNRNVHRGVLKNGLTYFIFPFKDPHNIVSLRIVEKTGALNCEAHELGAAHLIEHVGLRSTVNFPEGMSATMNRLGLNFSSSIVAKTGSLETYYEISVPSTDSVLLHYGLLSLHDFAKGRLYLENEVEEERAIVLNEAALRHLGSINGIFELLDKNPLFVATDDAEIKSYKEMSTETLKRFDQKWYRPELQAVIVVGDVDVKDVERKINSMFADLKSESNEPVPSIDLTSKFDVPLNGRNKLVVANRGATNVPVRLEILQKRKSVANPHGVATLQQMRLNVMDQLYNTLAHQRFESVGLKTQTAFHLVDRGAVTWLAGIDALTTTISVDKILHVQERIEFTMTELHRIGKWGFTEKEFESASQTLRKSMLSGGVPLSANFITGRLAEHFVYKSAFADDEDKLQVEILTGIKLEDINSMAREWIAENGNTDVLMVVQNEKDPALPTQQQIFKWIAGAMTSKVKPWVEKVNIVKSLPLPPPDVAGKFDRTELAEVSATQVVLNNGVKVIFKRLGSVAENPWPDLGDVFMTAIRKSGTAAYGDKDYPSAVISADLIRNSGIASLNAKELEVWLKDKRQAGELSVYPYILETESGISGGAVTANVQELFQLGGLYFTAPRKDKAVFNKMLERQSSVGSRTSQVTDSIQFVVTGMRPRGVIGQPNFDKAIRIYRESFANASEFTFVVTGYFEVDEMIRHATRYLGALPASKSMNVVADTDSKVDSHNIAVTNRSLRATLVDDSTGTVMVKMLFFGTLDYNVRNKLMMMVAGKVMSPILHNRVREKEKGVYWIIASAGFRAKGKNNFVFTTEFPTAPENVDRLMASVIDEIHKVSKANLDDSTFATAVTTVRSEIANDLKNIYYIQEYMLDQVRSGTWNSDGLKREAILEKITVKDVINLFRDSLDTEHFAVFEQL